MLKKLFNLFTNKFYVKILYIFIGLSFATIISDLPYFNLFNKMVLAYSLLLVVFSLLDIIILKRRAFFLFEIFLYMFLAFTLFLNYKFYNLSDNLNIWLVNLMITTVLFSVDSYKSKKILFKELNIISYFYVIFSFILSSLNILIFYVNKTNFNITYVSIFKNENSLGICAGIGIILSIYLLYISKNKFMKIFNVLNILFQFITLVLSGGRSGYLLLISILLSYLLFKLKKNYQRILIIVIPIVLAITSFFILPKSILHKILTSREYIWQSAIKLISKYPLTGVGNVNKVGRLQDVRVDYLQGLEGGGLHNIFFEVAVINGLISLILFLLFLISLSVFLFKNINKISISKRYEYFFIFSLIIGLIFVNMLESSLLYIISFISIIFWIYSGYLVAIVSNNNSDNNKSDNIINKNSSSTNKNFTKKFNSNSSNKFNTRSTKNNNKLTTKMKKQLNSKTIEN